MCQKTINNSKEDRFTDILALESENVEFKEAKNSYEFDNPAKYVCAQPNLGAGCFVFESMDKNLLSKVDKEKKEKHQITLGSVFSNNLKLRFVKTIEIVTENCVQIKFFQERKSGFTTIVSANDFLPTGDLMINCELPVNFDTKRR